MQRRILLPMALVLFLVSGSAIAQESKATISKKKTVVYEKETVMQFDDTLVEGKVAKPDGFFLLRKRPKKWQDLLLIREDYNEELGNMKFDL